MKPICYTLLATPAAHVRILSERDGALTVVQGKNSTEPGRKHFGVKTTDLAACGCGRWQWATQGSSVDTAASENRRSTKTT